MIKKNFLFQPVLGILLFHSSMNAQITFENTFKFGIVGEVYLKSVGWKYMRPDMSDHTVKLYNLNYSLYKTIVVPPLLSPVGGLRFLSESLFDTDSTDLEYMGGYLTAGNPLPIPHLGVFEESGNQIFTIDSVYLIVTSPYYGSGFASFPILATDSGTFLITYKGISADTTYEKIYRLPGSLDIPTCCQSLGGLTGNNPDLEQFSPNFNLLTFPNPAKSYTKVYYNLPENISSGELIFFNTLGEEVKRFKVDELFSYIQISTDDLPSGTYSYRIHTEKGDSEGKQLVVVQ